MSTGATEEPSAVIAFHDPVVSSRVREGIFGTEAMALCAGAGFRSMPRAWAVSVLTSSRARFTNASSRRSRSTCLAPASATLAACPSSLDAGLTIISREAFHCQEHLMPPLNSWHTSTKRTPPRAFGCKTSSTTPSTPQEGSISSRQPAEPGSICRAAQRWTSGCTKTVSPTWNVGPVLRSAGGPSSSDLFHMSMPLLWTSVASATRG
mmetsp:Transcript_84604/g.161745  ORF Transcript_84604/g.161745 Transcript_84604/m.161745 type:complete len:208 (+) Transcript_84604:2288-2911(+)